MKQGKHNAFAHILLGGALFAINSVFFGAATWTTVLETGAGAAGLILGAQSGDFASLETQGLKLLAVVVTIIIHIVLYYALAAVILFIFNMFFGRKKQ